MDLDPRLAARILLAPARSESDLVMQPLLSPGPGWGQREGKREPQQARGRAPSARHGGFFTFGQLLLGPERAGLLLPELAPQAVVPQGLRAAETLEHGVHEALRGGGGERETSDFRPPARANRKAPLL